jgi:hypothetical protein
VKFIYLFICLPLSIITIFVGEVTTICIAIKKKMRIRTQLAKLSLLFKIKSLPAMPELQNRKGIFKR